MFAHRGDTYQFTYSNIPHESVSVKPTKQVFGKFSARLRMVCGVFAARVARLRVARRRAPSQASVHESARYTKSLRSEFEPPPPRPTADTPITYPLSKALPFLNLFGSPLCCCVVCAAGGECSFFWAWWRKNFWYFLGLVMRVWSGATARPQDHFASPSTASSCLRGLAWRVRDLSL